MNPIFKFRAILKSHLNDGKLNASLKDFSRITYTADDASNWISEKILSGEPFIVSRFGNVELEWYIKLKVMRKHVVLRLLNFLIFNVDEWRIKHRPINHTYFVPGDLNNSLFYEKVMDLVIPEIDFLASWSKGEINNNVKLKHAIPKAHIFDIEPFRANIPWTLALRGKKVLVINPMVDLFEEQLKNRDKLFNKPTLPDFELVKLKALFFGDAIYNSWEKVFEYYETEIPKLDFDIAIIGCGTWGMPICKIVKDMGKGAIHLGGATQLVFGVMGKRWSDWLGYKEMVNEYWITEHKEKPDVANIIEGACYW